METLGLDLEAPYLSLVFMQRLHRKSYLCLLIQEQFQKAPKHFYKYFLPTKIQNPLNK